MYICYVTQGSHQKNGLEFDSRSELDFVTPVEAKSITNF